MSYYDEEIILDSSGKDDISSNNEKSLGVVLAPGSKWKNKSANMISMESTDEDDLIETNNDSVISDRGNDLQNAAPKGKNLEINTRMMNAKYKKLLTTPGVVKESELSETESDEETVHQKHITSTKAGLHTQSNITIEKIDSFPTQQDVKDIFSSIFKYTPQCSELIYHLQPFIPEFVPAVGDVDAFLRVTHPSLLNEQYKVETNEHLNKMGVYFLDEPSGEQSEPSLLNMKMRSVLSKGNVGSSSASFSFIPTAKSLRDIDKWITEVEHVHMTQLTHDSQPRRDIEALLLDWPHEFAEAKGLIQDLYQENMQREDILKYINTLSKVFGAEGSTELQIDYIFNVQTLFALYLAANQAWE